MTAGYFVVCAVGNGALLISVGSVLQPLSLGFPAGEPMPVDFVRAVAKSVVEVAAPYNVWERVPSIFASFVGR